MFRHILVPTDGSAPSRKALKHALALARQQKARITAFYVAPRWRLPPYSEYVPERIVTPKEHEAAMRKAATRLLDAVRKAAAAARVRCRCEYVLGDYPHAEIVKEVRRRRCDLIVIASHGRRGISRLLLGSVTSKVLAESPVPVLVVR